MGGEPQLARRLPAWLAAAGVALALGFTLHQAVQVRLHYYDSFDYMNDARRLNGDESAAYYRVHAPLVPVLARPIVSAIVDAEDAGDPVRWILPHLLGWAMAALALLAAWLWMRERAGAGWALLGVLLLCSTRLFIRYAPFLLVDIATAGWVALAFFAWARATCARGEPRHWLLFGLAVAGGMLTKYSLGALPFAFIAAELMRIPLERRLRLRRIAGALAAGVVAAVAFWLFLAAVFREVDGEPFTLEAFQALIGGASAMVEPMPGETQWDYGPMLLATVSPITVALALVGVPVGLRRDWRRDLPALLWMLGFTALISFRVGHNEARYLWPALPALAYFAMIGARWLYALVWSRLRARRLLPVVGASVVALATWPAFVQARRDTHPFFYADTQPDFLRFIQEETRPPRRAFWTGHFVALTPPSPNEGLVQDEFMDFFHLSHPPVHLFTDAQMIGVATRAPADYLRRQDGAGDVLVVGPPGFVFAYADQSGQLEPPETFDVWSRRRAVLRRAGDAYVDDSGEAWFHWRDGALVATRAWGEVDLTLESGPLPRRSIAEGERVALPAAPRELEAVSVRRRTFPASWSR